MNRVNQIYETESAIRMVLIADNDKLNLNTVALATRRERPVRRGGAATRRRTPAATCSPATGS